MHTQQEYESLNKEIEDLHDQLTDLVAEKLLLTEDVPTFSDKEVCGTDSTVPPVIDEDELPLR